jgi:hypothetical protein
MSQAMQLRQNHRMFTQFLQNWELPAFLTGVGVRLVIASLMVVLGVGYIVQIGTLTTSGYQIAALEKQVNSLDDDTQKLKSELATFQSISNVEKRIVPGSMIPASNIRHIKVTSETVIAQR